MSLPDEVTYEEIRQLSDSDLRDLIVRLCESELRNRGLPTSAIGSGGHQKAPDGGLDVTVELAAGTPIDGWIPRPVTGFQVKHMKMPASEIRREMMPKGEIRRLIRDLADRSGAYIIVTNERMTENARKKRLAEMRKVLVDTGGAFQLALEFYDIEKIAVWLRDHRGHALWVKAKIGKPMSGWRCYEPWADPSEEAAGSYIPDEKLRIHWMGRGKPEGLSSHQGIKLIRDRLRCDRSIVRLVGLSGVGKTRLAHALFDPAVGNGALDLSLVRYANMAEAPEPEPTAYISQLIANKTRAVLVVDNCSPALHRNIASACRREGSTVSLLTIEYDITDSSDLEGTEFFRLDSSSPDLIGKLIKRRFPGLSGAAAQTIAQWSDGNSRIAAGVAATVGEGEVIDGLRDADFRRRFILGRSGADDCLQTARACSLVNAFQTDEDGMGPEVACLATLAEQTTQTFFKYAADLHSRGVLQQRGNQRALLPPAIANPEAEEALKRIPPLIVREQLVDRAPPRLRRSFSRRLGQLTESPEAKGIVRGWLAPGGMLSDILSLDEEGAAMFGYVAPVLPALALETMERVILSATDGPTLMGCARYSRVIRSLAYEPDYFERIIAMLVKIANATAQDWRSNRMLRSTASFFQIQYCGTNVSVRKRIDMIERLLTSSVEADRAFGLLAVRSMLTLNIDVIIQQDFGPRVSSFGFWPSAEDLEHSYESLLTLCASLICAGGPVAADLRQEFADQLRGLWICAPIPIHSKIARACEKISASGFWPEGWAAIRSIQQFDAAEQTVQTFGRLAELERSLAPKNLVQRVQALVFTEYEVTDVGDAGVEDRILAGQRGEEIAKDLGSQVGRNPTILRELLPTLLFSKGRLWAFGSGMAQGSLDPEEIWRSLVGAVAQSPNEEIRFDIFCGFLTGVKERDAQLTIRLLEASLLDRFVAKAFPALQAAVGMDAKAGERILWSLANGFAPTANYEALARGGGINALSSREFRAIVVSIASRPDGFRVAIELLAVRLKSEEGATEGIHSDVIAAGREVIQCTPILGRPEAALDQQIGRVATACLRGAGGRQVGVEVLLRLRNAAVNLHASIFHYNRLIIGVFSTHPVAALDALCGGDLEELRMGCRLLSDLQHNPLNAVPTSDLLDWCDREPGARYAEMAATIPIITNPKDPDNASWSRVAFGLVDRCPNRSQVLEGFLIQLESAALKAEVSSESLMKLLSALAAKYSHEVVIGFFEDRRRYFTELVDARQRRNARLRLREQCFE